MREALGVVMVLALMAGSYLFLAAVTDTLPQRRRCPHETVVEFGPARGKCAHCGVRIWGRL